ncbi:hypothetical protein BH20VER2_BH20VER2_02660 [soil metagenome]|nr:zinc ribbon domain-containing protein [Chthoniobacterales bacterium]
MKLVCPECRRENEPERIYCHDCGARLDRSGLSKAQRKDEDPKETQKRLRGMMNPQGAKMRHLFFQGSKLLLGALTLAAVVQMLRAPEVPESSDELMMASQINLELENAAMGTGGGPLRYTQEQVNEYLAYTLKSKQAALSTYLNFQRAVAEFGEGYGQLTVERSLFGLSVFTTAAFGSPTIADGAITAQSRGGMIGRLPVHPALMEHGGPLLMGGVWKALDRERRSVAKLGSVEFHEKSIFLAPRPRPQP